MLNKNYKPLGDRVIIKKPEADLKSESGKIILQESTSRGKIVWGEVLAVGVGIYTQTGDLIPMSINVGDEVMYKQDMAGDPIKIDGEEYILFREIDLIMVKAK